MEIAFRTNGSSAIGLGHVMRCMTLAEMLRQFYNAEIQFWINIDMPDAMVHELKSSGFEVHRVMSAWNGEHIDQVQDANACIQILQNSEQLDLIIVDHYGLDQRWEVILKPYCRRLMVIDDLANRKHSCHMLLDQNLSPNMELRYAGLVSDTCMKLIGPSYALLRQQFYAYKNVNRQCELCRHVLISFGGSDPTSETLKVLDAIEFNRISFMDIAFTVVAGPANPKATSIQERCNSLPNVTYLSSISNMAELLNETDLAIGAGGISIWERAFMGVPSLVISVASNQIEAVLEGAHKGLLVYVGNSENVGPNDIAIALSDIISDSEMRKNMSYACREMMHKLIYGEIHPILSGINNIWEV